MATNITYRASITPTVPSTTTAKNLPLTNLEVDGNFKSLVNSVDAKAPIDSPTFTTSANSVTPSLGDNSTKIATTAYVMNVGFRYLGISTYSNTITLPSTDLTKVVYFTGSSNYTATLPSVAVNQSITLSNLNQNIITIAAAGASLIYGAAVGTSGVSSFTLSYGESVTLTGDGISWLISNFSKSFNNLLSKTNRISADFTNSTYSSRTMFQTVTTNGFSVVGVLPNGTSTDSAVAVYNNSSPDNASYGALYSSSSEVRLTSDINGSGSYVPISFYTGGAKRATLDTSGNLTFQSTGSAINNVSSINGGQLAGFRNRVQNGQMRVDQRNNGASVTPSISGFFTLDRFRLGLSQSSKLSFQQVTDSPPGFATSIKVTTASVYTAAAADFFTLEHTIEATNIIDFQYGLATAQTATLSFWAKASIAGIYYVSLVGASSTRSYISSFSLTSSWTRISIVIPGDITGSWPVGGIGAGLTIRFDLGSGSNLSSTSGSWLSSNSSRMTGGVSLVSNSAATFNLTGIQLELGNIATPFEQIGYDQELKTCERYFTKIQACLISGYNNTGGTIYAECWFPTYMRSSPTAILPTINYSNASGANIIAGYNDHIRLAATITSTGSGYADISGTGIQLSADL